MILLLDNYDSFTYNLYDYLSQCGVEVLVKRNDEITVNEIHTLSLQAIVISPGPKKPANAGITLNTIHHFKNKLPMLGICLGYQAIGEYFGATLIKSPVPVHGKTSHVKHEDDPIFKGIPFEFPVMRYHSLNIENIPAEIKVIASTVAGSEPMALKHIELPLYGLQFHPESILTEHGLPILRNWVQMLG
ncbi:MAG: anthranilate synthase component II [Chitinophagales bacterium]